MRMLVAAALFAASLSACGPSEQEKAAAEQARQDSVQKVRTDTAFARIARLNDWHAILDEWGIVEYPARWESGNFSKKYPSQTAAVANFKRVAAEQAESYLLELEIGFDPFDWGAEGEKARNIRFIAEQLGGDTAILARLERVQDKLAVRRIEHSIRLISKYQEIADTLKATRGNWGPAHNMVSYHVKCVVENLRLMGKKPEDFGLKSDELDELASRYRTAEFARCTGLVVPRN